jgi:hypothetical protein
LGIIQVITPLWEGDVTKPVYKAIRTHLTNLERILLRHAPATPTKEAKAAALVLANKPQQCQVWLGAIEECVTDIFGRINLAISDQAVKKYLVESECEAITKYNYLACMSPTRSHHIMSHQHIYLMICNQLKQIRRRRMKRRRRMNSQSPSEPHSY